MTVLRAPYALRHPWAWQPGTKPPVGMPLRLRKIALCEGVVAFWPLNEGGGVAVNIANPDGPVGTLSSNGIWKGGLGGVGVGAPSTSTGQSMAFPSDSRYKPTVSASFYAQFQVFSNTTQYMMGMDTAASGWSFADFGSGTVGLELNNGGFIRSDPATAYSSGQLQRLGWTFDNTALKSYSNGIQASSTANGGTIQYPSTGFSIGSGDSASTNGNPSATTCYVAIIWNRTLTPWECFQVDADPWSMVEPDWDQMTLGRATSPPPPPPSTYQGAQFQMPGVSIFSGRAA